MQDTIIKGTGNSRSLRSVPNFLTLYPSYEAFAQALVAGTLPIDLGALNPTGLGVQGTDLSKANLLSDGVEADIWGSAANRTPNQAFQQLRALIAVAQSSADRQRFIYGTYVGNGADSQKIQLPFTPQVVFVLWSGTRLEDPNQCISGGLAVNGAPAMKEIHPAVSIETGGFLVYYYRDGTYHNVYTNHSNRVFTYFAM